MTTKASFLSLTARPRLPLAEALVLSTDALPIPVTVLADSGADISLIKLLFWQLLASDDEKVDCSLEGVGSAARSDIRTHFPLYFDKLVVPGNCYVVPDATMSIADLILEVDVGFRSIILEAGLIDFEGGCVNVALGSLARGSNQTLLYLLDSHESLFYNEDASTITSFPRCISICSPEHNRESSCSGFA